MDIQLSCTSHSSWIWVIEALACSNQVDVSLLLAFRVHGTVDLLEKTQEISDDLGRNARELVSLRILEITNQKEGSAAPVSTASSSKIDLEPLERCEDVLKQILIETSASNLKTPGPDLLKWNLKPFIVQKQASKTKCFLRLLKDAILTGSHPLDESIKEKSDIFPVDQDGHEIPVDGGNHFIRRTFEGSNKNVHYGVGLGSLDSSNLNGSTFSHRNVPRDSLLQDERARSYSSKDDAQKLCDDDSMRESGCESAKNLKITTECVDKVEKNIQKNVPNVDEVEDDMECVLGFKSTNGIMEAIKQNVQTNAGECEDFTVFSDVGYDEGRTDSMTQKNSFLCSQYACSLDSLGTAEWREQNLCVKCCKDGKLLVCKGNACPFVAHESCLGSAASFDSEGNFYCPFCSYSQAIKQYEEAKKNSLLARKDLSTFYCFRSRRQSNKQPLTHNEMELDERLGKASEIVHGDTMKGIENHQNKRKLEEFIGHSALNCGSNLPGQGKPVESTIVTLLTTDKNNQDEQIKGKVCKSLVDPGQQQMTSFVQFDCLGENSSLQVSERGDAHQKLDLQVQKKCLTKKMRVLMPRST